MQNFHGRFGALTLALVIACAAAADDATADDATMLDVSRFSAAQPGTALPPGWKPLTFDRIERHTSYSLVADDGTTVLKAEARASALGLVRPVTIDAREYPVLRWRWKIANLVERADPRRKDGDDYPARLYVTFKYDPARVAPFDRVKYALIRFIYGEYPPHAGINYVWDGRTPVGASMPNAYTDRVRMIVVRSGATDVGRWVSEERNVYEDYKRAFGEEPPPISGIAVMTDTDNTGESATAWYGDIEFRRRAQ